MKYIRLYITKSICGGSIFMFFVGDPLPRINGNKFWKSFLIDWVINTFASLRTLFSMMPLQRSKAWKYLKKTADHLKLKHNSETSDLLDTLQKQLAITVYVNSPWSWYIGGWKGKQNESHCKNGDWWWNDWYENCNEKSSK